jgi:pyruvate/2-oxoglutarate dehydrogenase complex dihydrolipoamide dehydrogenase (E3) component
VRQAVVVATGSTPTVPDLPDLRDAEPWTNREFTAVDVVPASIVVLGGGVVACEAAAALNGLGSHVTLLSRSGLLGRAEPFAGELVADALRAAGVDVRLGADVTSVHREGPTVTAALGDGTTVVAEEVLCALGRRPATTGLGLETVGIEPGAAIDVDDTLRSAVPWLYAVGDVNGRAALTHQGKYQARACGDVIAARATGSDTDDPRFTAYADHRMVPQVVFTDPQVAWVGLTAEQARTQGFDVRVVEYDLGKVAGAALLADGYTGRASMVVDEARKVPIGFTFVGREVAELLHSATVAVVGELPLSVLWHAVPSYPTVSEVWLRLLETYGL